ncbi:MAG: iron donor protein CyaY [Deltaproteobacteria bacterium]
MALTESQFEMQADATLTKMVDALADLEDDALEADLESGVLSLRFEDGAKFVVNSHRAALQIWMAAGATAWHFDFDGKQWIAAKSGDELWDTVEKCTSEKLGRPIRLR